MTAITLRGVPDDAMERLRTLAEEERRSVNQQAILLLERALAEQPRSFGAAYREFRDKHGPSPLKDDDLEGLRSTNAGRL